MLNIFGWFLQQKLKQSLDDKNRSRRHHFFSHFSFNSRTFFHRYLVKLSQTFNLKNLFFSIFQINALPSSQHNKLLRFSPNFLSVSFTLNFKPLFRQLSQLQLQLQLITSECSSFFVGNSLGRTFRQTIVSFSRFSSFKACRSSPVLQCRAEKGLNTLANCKSY